ncbi:hypothetical protein [Devosia psychrophila]|uniref:Uncharacterized protein n=1 Tax=Devosia psychrophila TaxID=728005 RepID=A0A0F5PX28_9HYPH|nr:hypothetical protein [Devosia psychrophila]KKC32966.1 hypothetical protein WH91_11245 [Devosia psychrophila]SFD05405.1 hypothetical protein SAMN04488059_1197 [Devosia psychrophila]
MTSILAKSNPRGGRPKLAPEDVRKPYGIGLSIREREEAGLRADEAGLDLSGYCRNAILNASSPRPVPSINLQAWLQLNTLAEALIGLSRTHSGEIGDDSLVERLGELEDLLQSTRFALLGIHYTTDDQI